MSNSITFEAFLDQPLPIWVIITLVFGGLLSFYFYFHNRNRRSSLSSLPVVEKLPGETWMDVVAKGTKKWPTTPYILPLPTSPRVVLPLSLVPTIISLPETQISRRAESYRRFFGYHTRIGIPRPPAVKTALRVDLTRNLPSLLPALQDEISLAIDAEIGACADWTPIEVLPTVMKIVAALSARTFVGLPLCREKNWRGMTLLYAMDLLKAIQAIRSWSPRIGWAVAPFLKQVVRLRFYRMWVRKKMGAVIKDMIREMEREEQEEKKVGKGIGKGTRERDHIPHGKNYDSHNLIHWILNNSREKGEKHPPVDTIAEFQLFAAVAAIQTTGIATTNAILDLATYPQYVDELREEIEGVVGEENDGKLNMSSMTNLKKLDSFMKESLRFNPLTVVSLPRMVTSSTSLTLPGDIVLPYGTSTVFPQPSCPSIPIPANEPSPDSSPPLSEFHPFRYADLRSPSDPTTTTSKQQFATTSPTYLSFGHGWQACPGRFFASNEIKLILVEVLRRYELALGEGGKGVEDGEVRPKGMESETMVVPDLKGKVYLRSRGRKGEEN